MPPGGVDQRLFERFDLDPPPAVRLTYLRVGSFRTKTIELRGFLTDLSLDGAAIDLAEWEPENGSDMTLFFGSASTIVEIRSFSRRRNGTLRLHLRFRQPPEDFKERVRAFADHMAKQRRDHLAKARDEWAGHGVDAGVRSFG